ncbi:MAG TPA: hypothetical protein VGB55_15015 [Tepidisphaeraceae bacterium]|jgi:hypothetical protein
MSLQKLRVWQWCIIGAVLGAAVAFVWTSENVEDLTVPNRELSAFLRGINQRTDTNQPIYTDIRIDPVKLDQSQKPIQSVTFSELMKHKETGQWEPVRKWRTMAPIPVLARSPNKDYRLSDYLAERKKDIPELSYTYNWWKISNVPAGYADRELHFWQRPNYAWPIAIAAGVVLIGIIWPIIIRLLVKAGLGYPEEPKDAFDLSQVAVTSAGVEAPKTVSAAESQKLADLNAQLEENVAGMMIQDEQADEAEERRQEEAVIRKLEGKRLEAQASANANDGKDKDFKGEYYPVARPIVKKD